ncbi:MAG: hypothetical protein IKC11_03550 [Clostridia bacterium]|nr:hypothetical protein [Clostridia bacterium]
MKKKRNFVISRTHNGILVKRFYNVVKDEHGMPKREYTYSRRMNLPEKLLYKFTTYYDLPISSQKKQKSMSDKTLLTIATFLAGATVVAGVSYALLGELDDTNDSSSTPPAYHETGSMPSQESQDLWQTQESTAPESGYVVPDTPPEPVTYIDNGVEFVSLDSIIEISKYNHAQLVKEIAEYNKTAPENKQIEFDTDLFSPEFFAAIAIQENSLKTKSPTNPNHYGCYQIGAMAFEEAQLLANKLGTTLPEDIKDLENPLYGNKVSMYIYVQNYNRYLKDAINERGCTDEEQKAIITTAYLNGGPSTAERVRNGEFVDSIYHTKIDLYEDIVDDFSTQLYEGGLIAEDKAEERATARRNAFNKLYEVTNESASKILAEKKAQAQQTEREQ